MIGAIADVLLLILQIYTWVVIAAVIMSWLVSFGVINMHNQFARSIAGVLYALTEPVFSRIRRIIPAIGGLDLSPLVVLIAIFFLERVIVRLLIL